MLSSWIQWLIAASPRGVAAVLYALLIPAVVGAADSTGGLEAWRAGDYGRAVAELREPAAAGDAAAQFHLGLAFALGHGVLADPAKAARWYERAARAGHAKAQVNLAIMLLDGAYDSGVDAAQRARDWLLRAVQQGDGRAAHRLGLMYYRGQGVERDYSMARDWWLTGVEQGDASSAFNLGVLYRRGLGVVRDVGKTTEWWERAAYAGLAEAQNALGGAYQNGEGVTFDLVEAWAWFSLAAAGGLPIAELNAELIRGRLDAPDLARAEARRAELASSMERDAGAR
jgi:uncharacterized protein